MQWNNRKLKEIEQYQKKKYEREYPYNIPWKGPKPVPFQVYNIPTKLLSYNFNNTRIKAELEGELYRRKEKSDQNNPKHHKLIQRILLESKWIGDYETTKLTEDLQKRGQLDPVIATPDGVLIDGNRRLAIFRYLEENEPESTGFREMEVCILPEDSTEDDLKELEMRLQMYHQFQVSYGDFNTALEFRYLHKNLNWTLERISDITGNQFTITKIEKMIQIIDMVDEYLNSIPPEKSHNKQYSKLDKGWESFDNIYRMLQWTDNTSKNDENLRRNRKLFGFEIIYAENRTYADVRHFYSVLRSAEANERLERTSDTIKGKNLNHFLSKARVEKEMKNLDEAFDYLESLKIEPSRVAEQAYKKLDTIKIHNIDSKDRSLKIMVEKLLKKISQIKEHLD